MGCFGKKRSGYAKPGASGKHKKTKKGIQYANRRRVSGCFAALSYILSIALAAISLSGCSYSNSFSKGLYVAEIRRNASEGMPQLHLSVGYFGGCITLLDGTQPDVQASNSSDIGGEIRCITNMHAVDEDDLLEELSEELKNPDNQFIQSFLIDTLHQARHFQKEVFHFAVPVTQLILFVVGGAMLFTASTNVVPKKSYRYLLVLAFLFIVFAMGLMFTTAFGSLQALHGLVNEQDSKLPPWAINSKNDSIHFANRLYFIQVGQACMVICFAIFIGFMFAGGLRAKRKGVV